MRAKGHRWGVVAEPPPSSVHHQVPTGEATLSKPDYPEALNVHRTLVVETQSSRPKLLNTLNSARWLRSGKSGHSSCTGSSCSDGPNLCVYWIKLGHAGVRAAPAPATHGRSLFDQAVATIPSCHEQEHGDPTKHTFGLPPAHPQRLQLHAATPDYALPAEAGVQ